MRRIFFQELYKNMDQNDKIISLTGDLGYGGFDKIISDFPDRFFNCQAAELSMMGVACGLALEGKIPVVYSIGTFLIYRPFEIIRTYINHENMPVKLISSGRDKDYEHDGISHWMDDIKIYLDTFKNIKQYWPEKQEEIASILPEMLSNNRPCFLSLKR
jgi:transketolase